MTDTVTQRPATLRFAPSYLRASERSRSAFSSEASTRTLVHGAEPAAAGSWSAGNAAVRGLTMGPPRLDDALLGAAGDARRPLASRAAGWLGLSTAT